MPGSPGGRGGLEYLGDDLAGYKRLRDQDEGRRRLEALVNLCKVLNQTPADKLEAALKPILDIDGALWFLALDVALVNSDGYWMRASDYSLYRDAKGRFHIIPHDMNEGRGVGGRGGRGGGPGGPARTGAASSSGRRRPRRIRRNLGLRGPPPGGQGAGGSGGPRTRRAGRRARSRSARRA